MKKIILLIALSIGPIVGYGQSIYDTLEDMDGISSIVISKDAFDILSKFNVNLDSNENDEMLEVFTMIKDLNELKIFSSENLELAPTMESLVTKEVKTKKLTQLMRIKEDNSRVLIYVNSGKNKEYVSEVLMFVKGINKKTGGMSEAVIVSLTGTIDINKMSKLADTFTKKNNK